MAKKKKSSWTAMLREEKARERIEREAPGLPAFLDFLNSRLGAYEGYGWTVFTDWLEKAHSKYSKLRPENIKFFSQQTIWGVVFPATR